MKLIHYGGETGIAIFDYARVERAVNGLSFARRRINAEAAERTPILSQLGLPAAARRMAARSGWITPVMPKKLRTRQLAANAQVAWVG